MNRNEIAVFWICIALSTVLVPGVIAEAPSGIPAGAGLTGGGGVQYIIAGAGPEPAPAANDDRTQCSCSPAASPGTSACGGVHATCECAGVDAVSGDGIGAASQSGSSGWITADCSQGNALDSGGCCCWVGDPTGAHAWGHVLDIGVVVDSPVVYFQIRPGCGDCQCHTTGYFYYSEDGVTWTRFYQESNLAGWTTYSRTRKIGGKARYFRANTDACSVDWAYVSVPYSSIDNNPPKVVDIEWDPVEPTTRNEIRFGAMVSETNNFDILSYIWTETDVATGRIDFAGEGNPLYVRPDPGTHGLKKIQCQVTYQNSYSGQVGLSDVYEEEFNLFFDLKGEDTPNQKRSKIPNWYVYWKRDGAVPDLSQFKFDKSTDKYGYSVGDSLYIGPYAKDGRLDIVSVDPSIHIFYTGYVPGGIIRVADICAHELQHKYFFDRRNGEWKNQEDLDKDGLPNNAETGQFSYYSLFPTNPDTYNLASKLGNPDYATYGDEELLCRLFAKQSQNYEYHPDKDWAKPGSQTTSNPSPVSPVSGISGNFQFSGIAGETSRGLSTGFSETTMDSDGNGLFNQLIIAMGLNLPESGNYTVVAYLNGTDGKEVAFTNQEFILNTGVNTLPVVFDGFDINYHQVNGPFNLSYTLYSGQEGVEVENQTNAYTTAAYPYTGFEGSQAKFTDAYSDAGVESTDAARFRALCVDVNIVRTLQGNFSVWGELYDSAGTRICSARNLSAGDAGESSVGLSFDGRSIFANGISGPFFLRNLTLSDEENNFYDFREEAYTTATYDPADFRPAVSAGSVTAESPVDDDSDGLIDELAVTLSVTGMKAGNYSFIGTLTDPAGGSQVAKAGTAADVGTGSQAVQLRFDGREIAGSGIDGPYRLGSVIVLDEAGTIVTGNDPAYTTATYACTGFEQFIHADFTADPVTGYAPLTVQFTATSTGSPLFWDWEFGDDDITNATEQNPVHSYAAAGTYTVTVTATGGDDGDMKTRTGLIVVLEPPAVVALPGYETLPTDPDLDGICEDLNGNGRLDFADVVLYFTEMTWIAENEPVAAFDLNGNGRIDFADIVALFNEI